MKTLRSLAVLALLMSSFFLVGCSDAEDTTAPPAEGETTTPVETTDSSTGAPSEREQQKEELRDKIRDDRMKENSGSNDATVSPQPDQLAQTGTAPNVFLVFGLFAALVYVGIKRKFAPAKQEVDII